MRMIDADKLVDMLYDNEFAVLCPLDEVSGVVDACPTVDAVVVTRCKDCKHYRTHPHGLCYLHTEPKENKRGYSGEPVCVEPDDFCSYGEPKERTHADDHD